LVGGSLQETRPVKLLLDAKAKADHIDVKGLNPMCHAAMNGHTEILKLLLDSGIHPDATGPNKQTALSWAVLAGNLPSVMALLDAGAKPNLPDKTGLLPLQIAEDKGQTAIAAMLKDHNAPSKTSHALNSLALVSQPHLPDNWTVADPFDDKTPYYTAYALLSTVYSPPETYRALLRADLEDQSQIFIIYGKQEAWQQRFISAQRDLAIGTETLEEGQLSIEKITLDYAVVRQPPGILAGDDVIHLLAQKQYADRILIVDAGGLNGPFDIPLIKSIITELKLSSIVSC
jgi:hypothetical protein|tara:strand:+ start:6753 stop:7616 length:864 start_codon:yes stop_codon:yes gene_type:complete